MSNLYKSGFINFRSEEAKIIESNAIVAERLRQAGFQPISPPHLAVPHLAVPLAEDGFHPARFDEMDEAASALLSEEGSSIYREAPEYDGPSPEELLEAAKAEIEEMRSAAAAQIQTLRVQALEEGRRDGYNDGFARGHVEALQEVEKADERAREAIRETEALRERLLEEHEGRLQEMERMVIDELTDIYDHVFAAGLKEQSEIIFHLLDTTLHLIDSGREFIVRVSQADYEYVSAHKEELLTGMPEARIDLVADVTMRQGAAMIETGGGLFDCGIDVELAELKRRIRTLAYKTTT